MVFVGHCVKAESCVCTFFSLFFVLFFFFLNHMIIVYGYKILHAAYAIA